MRDKKILIIDGSGRENGYTKMLIEFFKENCGCGNIVTTELFKEKFAFCDGCNYCEKNEKCRWNDLDAFFDEFEAADFIVFASPIYNGTFSAPMKALLDRFQVYYTYFYKHNKTQKIEKRRKAILITSSGRVGERWHDIMEEQLKFACSVLNIELEASVLCNFTDTVPGAEEAKNKIKRIIERIEGE